MEKGAQGKRRVRTVIGHSNRRHLIHSKLFYNGSTLLSSSPLGASEGAADTVLPHVPRATSALSGTIGGLNETQRLNPYGVGPNRDVSWGWASETMSTAASRGPHVQTPSDLIAAFRMTNTAAVSRSLSPSPFAPRERLDAQRKMLRSTPNGLDSLRVPTPLDLLSAIRDDAHQPAGLAALVPPAGAAAIDQRFMECPSAPSPSLAPAIAAALSSFVDSRTPAAAPQGSAEVAVAHRAPTLQRRPSKSVLGPGGLSEFLSRIPGRDLRTPPTSPVQRQRPSLSRAPLMEVVSAEVKAQLRPQTRLGLTPSWHGETERVVQPLGDPHVHAFANVGAQFDPSTIGLGDAIVGQEDRLRRLATAQCRVRRVAQQEENAAENIRRLEAHNEALRQHSLQRQAELKRENERRARESDANPRFVRFTASLLGKARM